MPRLEHVKRMKGSVCDDGGKIRRKRRRGRKKVAKGEEKERRRKEGEVPVQLHSFTFPASMSHTWKSLISRDLCVFGDPWSPGESKPLSKPPSRRTTRFFSFHAFKCRCFTSLSLSLSFLEYYGFICSVSSVAISSLTTLIYFRRGPPFLPFLRFFSLSLSLLQPLPVHESTCLFNYLFARFNGWTRSPSYYAYLQMRLEEPAMSVFRIRRNNKWS